jgi:hypothetical protein
MKQKDLLESVLSDENGANKTMPVAPDLSTSTLHEKEFSEMNLIKNKLRSMLNSDKLNY